VSRRQFGRFAEPAVWILVALRAGPRNIVRLIDDVRELDGDVGPGTLFGALARLEWFALIEPARNGDSRRAYRLVDGAAANPASHRGSGQ
jgi:DNA-binding PadR family transcriptional regulator